MNNFENEFNNVGGESNMIKDSCGISGFVISAACRVRLQNRFFLLIQIERGTGANRVERFLIFQISQNLFNELAGLVPECGVFEGELPTVPAGRTLELLCSFEVNNVIYIVFEIERAGVPDELVIVRSPRCNIITL